jgi:AraC-like DNA-binding protein
MPRTTSDRFKYDPSDFRQTFSDINIQLHCCRYWMIYEWSFFNLASPFWRLYYNTIGDSSVLYNGVATPLAADTIVIIPPNTPFSTRLEGEVLPDNRERVVRKAISSFEALNHDQAQPVNASDQLFIHFNLGNPYDLPGPGIYTFPVSENRLAILTQIKSFCMQDKNWFDFRVTSAVKQLLFGLLNDFPTDKWTIPKLDGRVAAAISYIEEHVGDKLSNLLFSDQANMVENAFARLFRENTGLSIRQYIKKKRVEKALILMHHSNVSMEEIALQCGFSDRFHFSKVFKERMGFSPVSYKKQLII